MALRASGIAALVGALALAWSGAAQARDGELTGTLKRADATGRVTIGYRESSIPFSYIAGIKEPIGYAIDLCKEIVDDMARELGRDGLAIAWAPVTSATRFDAIKSGAIDLECGSTTANLERRAVADFSPVDFVSATKLLTARSGPVKSYRDLGGKTVVVTEGTTNAEAVKAIVARLKLDTKVVTGRDHAESFAMVKAGQADAFALDDVLLYGLLAASPGDRPKYGVLDDALSYEPYGIMFARGDPAMAALVTATFNRLAQSGEVRWIYDRWFLKRLPGGERLDIPVSDELRGMWQMQGLPTE